MAEKLQELYDTIARLRSELESERARRRDAEAQAEGHRAASTEGAAMRALRRENRELRERVEYLSGVR